MTPTKPISADLRSAILLPHRSTAGEARRARTNILSTTISVAHQQGRPLGSQDLEDETR